MPGVAGSIVHPKGYGQFTSATPAKQLGVDAPNNGSLAGLTAVPDGAVKALIQCETQDIRWVDDATTPTATVGNLLKANNVLEYEGPVHKFKFIQVAATAVVNVSYYGI